MRSSLFRLFLVVIANILIAAANVFFIIPHEIFGGGLSGIAMILNKFINIGIGNWINVISVILIVLSFRILNRKIAIQTMISGVLFMLIFLLMMPYKMKVLDSTILSSIGAGILFGCGVSLCLKAESSSVSIDTLALLIHEKMPSYNFKRIMRSVSFALVILGLLFMGIKSVLLGILYTVVYNFIYTIFFRNGENKIDTNRFETTTVT